MVTPPSVFKIPKVLLFVAHTSSPGWGIAPHFDTVDNIAGEWARGTTDVVLVLVPASEETASIKTYLNRQISTRQALRWPSHLQFGVPILPCFHQQPSTTLLPLHAFHLDRRSQQPLPRPGIMGLRPGRSVSVYRNGREASIGVEARQCRLFGGEPGDDLSLCYRMLEYFDGLDYIDPTMGD